MWGVTTTDYVANFEHGRRPVFVFLCDGYSTTPLRWLIDSWYAIHENAGPDWHMVVPTVDPHHNDETLYKKKNYNIRLAREIGSIYGLERLKDPVLILDNFDDTRRQLQIKLPKSDSSLNDMMRDISDLSFKHQNLSRSDLTDRIYNDLTIRMATRKALSLAPKAASALFRLAKPATGF